MECIRFNASTRPSAKSLLLHSLIVDHPSSSPSLVLIAPKTVIVDASSTPLLLNLSFLNQNIKFPFNFVSDTVAGVVEEMVREKVVLPEYSEIIMESIQKTLHDSFTFSSASSDSSSSTYDNSLIDGHAPPPPKLNPRGVRSSGRRKSKSISFVNRFSPVVSSSPDLLWRWLLRVEFWCFWHFSSHSFSTFHRSRFTFLVLLTLPYISNVVDSTRNFIWSANYFIN